MGHSYQILVLGTVHCALKRQNQEWLFVTSWFQATLIADGKTEATEDQVEIREEKVDKYKWKENLAQHILPSTTSSHISSKIKNLHTTNEMLTVIQTNVTSKSTLFIIDVEDQLTSMHCAESMDPKGHLAEVKAHFDLMMKCHDNLLSMGSQLSEMRFATMIMLSLPPSYRLALQTITATLKANKTLIAVEDLVAFFTEEVQHRLIEVECNTAADAVLFA
jgi:hypothetical protein